MATQKSTRTFSLWLAAALLIEICVANSAFADPFSLDPDGEEEKPAAPANAPLGASNFLGTMGAGTTTTAPVAPAINIYATPTPKPKLGEWELEDVSGTQYERNYLNSRENVMRNELRKPMPMRAPVTGGLDELEEAIKSLNSSPSGESK